MFKMKTLGALTLIGMLAFATTAQAQSTNDSSSTASLQSSQSTNSTNAGVNALVNQYGANDIHTSVNQQVPISLVGYGSFSQNNCSNAVGVGASTKIFSFVTNVPKPEINCQHAVRSDQFGREAQLAKATGKPVQAEMLRSAGVWETCTSNEETTAMCIRMGLIKYVDASKPDLKQTVPAPQFAETEQSRVISKAAEPAHAPTNAVATEAPATPTAPKGDKVADSQQVVNNLPWAQRFAR